MKRKFEFVLMLVIVLSFMVATCSVSAANDKPIKILFDGEELKVDSPAELRYERTMVPIRSICDALNVETSWDNKTKTASFWGRGISLEMTINNSSFKKNGKEMAKFTGQDTVTGTYGKSDVYDRWCEGEGSLQSLLALRMYNITAYYSALERGKELKAQQDNFNKNYAGKPYTRKEEIAISPYISSTNRTMVPLRLVAEAFNCEVNYDAKTRTVTITDNIDPRELSFWERHKDKQFIVYEKTEGFDWNKLADVGAARLIGTASYGYALKNTNGLEADYIVMRRYIRKENENYYISIKDSVTDRVHDEIVGYSFSDLTNKTDLTKAFDKLKIPENKNGVETLIMLRLFPETKTTANVLSEDSFYGLREAILDKLDAKEVESDGDVYYWIDKDKVSEFTDNMGKASQFCKKWIQANGTDDEIEALDAGGLISINSIKDTAITESIYYMIGGSSASPFAVNTDIEYDGDYGYYEFDSDYDHYYDLCTEGRRGNAVTKSLTGFEVVDVVCLD